MKNTYELKTNIFGQDYLEMTTPDGVMSLVPIDPANADYQRYLHPEAEQFTPIVPEQVRLLDKVCHNSIQAILPQHKGTQWLK